MRLHVYGFCSRNNLFVFDCVSVVEFPPGVCLATAVREGAPLGTEVQGRSRRSLLPQPGNGGGGPSDVHPPNTSRASPAHTVSPLTFSLRNFWQPFSPSVRNDFFYSRKITGMVKTNVSIPVTNKGRHERCASLEL